MVDLPCYSIPALQNEFRKIIREICIKRETCDEDIEIVKILAPLTENPNAPDIYGETPINFTQNKEILSILKPYKNSTKRTRLSEK